jgi:hypothetical protein
MHSFGGRARPDKKQALRRSESEPRFVKRHGGAYEIPVIGVNPHGQLDASAEFQTNLFLIAKKRGKFNHRLHS